jgi:hypothetical protein
MAGRGLLGSGDAVRAGGTGNGDRADRGERAGRADGVLIDDAVLAGLGVQVLPVRRGGRVDGPGVDGGGAQRLQ